jgi:hypothetical protein
MTTESQWHEGECEEDLNHMVQSQLEPKISLEC